MSDHCDKCGTDLTEDNRTKYAFVVLLDGVPGGAVEKHVMDVCKNCKSEMKAFELAEVGMSTRTSKKGYANPSNHRTSELIAKLLDDPDKKTVLVICEGNLDAVRLQRKIEEAGMSVRAVVATGQPMGELMNGKQSTEPQKPEKEISQMTEKTRKIKWMITTKPTKDPQDMHPSDVETYEKRPPAWIGEHYTEEEALDAFHSEVPIKRLEDFEVFCRPYHSFEVVRVYFESDSHAEPAAVFMSEAIYQACLPALEDMAKEAGMGVNESVVGIEDDLFAIIGELEDAD